MKEFPLTPIRLLGIIFGIILQGFENIYIKMIGLSYIFVDTYSIIYNHKITKNIRLIFNTLVVLSIIFLVNQPEIKKNKLIYNLIITILLYDIYLIFALSGLVDL